MNTVINSSAVRKEVNNMRVQSAKAKQSVRESAMIGGSIAFIALSAICAFIVL